MAKKAKLNAKNTVSPEEKINRLKRKIERERKARATAEAVIEEQSRRIHIANEELSRSNTEMELKNEELASTMTKLTSVELQRKATTITLGVAVVLFVISEFAVEPVLEREIANSAALVMSKIAILGLLLPTEIIVSRLLERQVTNVDSINEEMYLNLLLSAYEDGIITDMERTILDSSRRQLGLSKRVAQELEAKLQATT
ncbi:MAG: hypothetical protein DWC07_06565 [Candidatus Poseidoniales archaeon]|nr:MAG: hypothetical protein DWC07_06565 [Candidatus Poseidoniales archaeon]